MYFHFEHALRHVYGNRVLFSSNVKHGIKIYFCSAEKYSFFESLKEGLQHLNLANNPQLTNVPPSVCELRRLLTLDLRGYGLL